MSIDRVKKELERGVKKELEEERDKLAEWVTNEFAYAFHSTDQADVIKSYSEIIDWVQTQPQYKDSAKAEFAQDADGWLIAYTKAKGCVIVTHEEYAKDAKKRIPIPNVCKAFNIEYIVTFAMLRALKINLD